MMYVARSVNNGIALIGVIKWVSAVETEILPLLLSHLTVALVAATHSCGNAKAELDRWRQAHNHCQAHAVATEHFHDVTFLKADFFGFSAPEMAVVVTLFGDKIEHFEVSIRLPLLSYTRTET